MKRAPWLDIGFGALLATAFVLPVWIGYRAWIPALCLAIALAALQGILRGRRPVVPIVLAAYLGIYAIAALLSDPDTFSLVEAGKYFAPPVLALAVAWACLGDPEARRRILWLAIGAVLIQIPVVLVQVTDVLVTFGRDSIVGVDTITGLLGEGAPGTLTQVGVLTGVIVVAAGFTEAMPRRWGFGIGIALLLLGALTSTRASYVFEPVALGGIAVVLYLAARTVIDRRLLRFSFAFPVLIVAMLVLLTGALYPGANLPFSSPERFEENLESNQATDETGPVAVEEPEQTTILPGRGSQLKLAVELSVDGGPVEALFGRGVGVTRYKDQELLSEAGSTDDPLTRVEQKTNGVWLPRILTETGYLGLFAFLGLLTYLGLLGWRNRALITERTWDGALVLALPGIAALTLACAFFNTVLAVQPYATLFWPIVGAAIAIEADARRARGDRPRLFI